MKDLIVLVADKNMDFLFKGLLPRIPTIERINKFSFESYVHPYRDAGIYNGADEFLRPFTNAFSYALVVFDYHGCGMESFTREEVETKVEVTLALTGWHQRASAIVIEPELENWIWVAEQRIQRTISWHENTGIYEWLHQNGWKQPNELKPLAPKEAFEAALRICRTPRSSSIYKEVSSSASYKRCTDAAFLKMLNQLKTWFG